MLAQLGSHHVMVVHADDGLDEISVGAATSVAELKGGRVTIYQITPEQFDISRADIASLKVETAAQSLQFIHNIFDNQGGAASDVVCLNAGAAIYVSAIAESLDAGIAVAREMLVSGKAKQKFQQLIDTSNRLAG